MGLHTTTNHHHHPPPPPTTQTFLQLPGYIGTKREKKKKTKSFVLKSKSKPNTIVYRLVKPQASSKGEKWPAN
jgi:hypothetical protein